MNNEEGAILEFLKGYPDDFVSRKEIARKAVRRQVYEEDPRWADGPLASLLSQRIIESDDSGRFRLNRRGS
jgi:hypothetical protein